MSLPRSISTMAAATVAAFVCVMALTSGAAQAQTIEYVALGDSYASGVGTRSYIDDGSGCSRSNAAYPALIADEIGADLTFAACSGATTGDLLAGQLGGLSDGTDLVTVTIGGNDTGWAGVVQKCAYPYPWTCTAEIAAAERFVREQLPAKLHAVYDAIATAAPNAEVVVLGYPRLFNGEQCNAITRISPAEQAALNDAADLLGDTIGTVAGSHGFQYVDVRDAFEGHAVCDDVEWINGLSYPIIESYHPNAAGQRDGYYALLNALVRSGSA
ncbi:SGNH/GDSL hydrolase family protein [Glycomyces sp. TRM65418]|uniref:SGNH/GDSL hydrolase family protein n=1 Tax=Glycomyces sp. TRM65418 TaxID=2867006 RepID=UPI001CE5AC54|nr:SGNH/GDSL hydrolase family protein [Glycomyces sp. TRM65418]MCC3763838.1 SGNH/GDSL hydrolase family protein [Glycomyces sp. TRM65418]QZD53542.1 SGNH/GDSL hydrolase family protein [Glycomyces sp. TRM65418]